mmetsp:Transcript_78399/g.123530  ORF Transcript_78399/g.123530 Transcript_78399/m.123530 type:complete len:291 (-) Transcript_78399:639-1511(-)
MDPALRSNGFLSWPRLAPKAHGARGTGAFLSRRPGRPLFALFVASKSWTRQSFSLRLRRRSQVKELKEAKVDTVDPVACEDEVFETMPGLSVLNLALSALPLSAASEESKKLVAQLQSAVKGATDFAELADDGVKPHLWEDADVVLVGPSRTGKTTLAKFLAKLGLRAANYPLVQGEDIPQDLFRINRSKLALLTTEAAALQNIRQNRMKRLGMASSNYAGLANIRRELDWVKMLYTRNFTGFPVINTAKCTIAEAASLVLSHMYGSHVDADTTTRLVNLISMLTHGSAT